MSGSTPVASAPPVAVHPLAGRLVAERLGVRLAERVGPCGSEAPPSRAHFSDECAADGLAAGTRRVGPLELELERVDHGDAATFHWRVRNPGEQTLQVESVVLGLRWERRIDGALRFLRHGWQSWSYTGTRDLDDQGEPAFPSGEWLRGMHHAVGAAPADRAGWHESDIVTLAAAGPDDHGPVCLAGVLETGEGFGSVYLRRAQQAGSLALEVEVRLEVPLAPGAERRVESVRVALGDDANRLLECFAELWGQRAGALTRAPFQAGWCSWYHFFHEVSEQDVLRNLEVLAAHRGEIPIDVVQLDDGYQSEVGDWLETNAKFPRGLAPLAADIRAAGFTPGIWTAPFCVVPESRLHAEHPEWLLRNGDHFFRGLAHLEWAKDAWVHALDTSREDVLSHLRSLFQSLVEMGFPYQKIDFLHAAAMRADAHDPEVTRAARLRRGLEAIREGAGPAAFLLGCGCPLGPAVGLVDGMRIGPDVAPSWEVDSPLVVPGLEPALPSTRSAVRSVMHRAFMHRRLWLNDPDCLMARSRDTKLTAPEIRTLASSIAATGGMLVFSDDMGSLSSEDRACVSETLAVSREVDAFGSRGAARAAGWCDADGLGSLVAAGCRDNVVALANRGDAPVLRDVSAILPPALSGARIEPLLGSPPADSGLGAASLEAHDSVLYRQRNARSLVVFCDFDGTFSVQDVGATLARQRAGERRPAQWARYERGEINAWEYNLEILDGLAVPESELDEFLKTIELDPGAADLVSWCERSQVPFWVLSDGFDLNLDRLQTIHGVRFEYQANRLRYEGEQWRIEAGYPNPECSCGTGTCKRGRIREWRATHPGAYCVHVGNGRVSDLCGAIEADLCFAKDSLAPALDERGVAYEPFATLHEVVQVLERRFHPEGRA